MGKLIGGNSAQHSKYKFVSSLRRKNIHICTACLLSNKHALTTAICLKDFLNYTRIPDFKLYSVVAGKRRTTGQVARFELEQVQTHQQFTFKNPNPRYDIGLITVNY